MQNLLEELKDALSKDERLVVDGKLSKNKIVELGLKLDEELLKLLLDNDRLKEHFFQKANNTFVFDKQEFQRFISNKQFLPDSYTAFKNKIGLTNGKEYLSDSKDVTLAWAYKDCVLEGGQTEEDAKRDEIFWNETLAPDQIDRLLDPKVLTNFKKYNEKGEHDVNEFSSNDNLVIRGNNLLALTSLQKVYTDQVKLIYIDPPYNTGNDDFGYNDNFNHSTWLTFLKNRIEVAWHLLRKDGTLAVSIDHNELGYLLVLLDEIFGRENLKNIITVKRGSVTGAKVINPGVVNVSEYVVLYSKDPSAWSPNRVYRKKERDDRYNQFIVNREDNPENWEFKTLLQAFADHLDIPKLDVKDELGRNFEKKIFEFVKDNKESVIQFATLDDNSISQDAVKMKYKSEDDPSKVYVHEREENSPYYIYRGKLILFVEDRLHNIDGELSFGELIPDIWTNVLPNDLHNEGGVRLRKGKKPEKLISRIVELCTDEEDLVLDFFAGSGTTGSVCMKMNRQFIITEQLDYIDSKLVERLKNTISGEQSGISKAYQWEGGGEFKFTELQKMNDYFVEKIQNATSSEEIDSLWTQMKEEAFLSYKLSTDEFDENADEFKDLELEKQKRLLIEILDKNQLYINYSEMDNNDFVVSESDKQLNHQFYNINN